jgi:hypothetical protein
VFHPLHRLNYKRVGDIRHNQPHPIFGAALHTMRRQVGGIAQIFDRPKHTVLRFAVHVRLSIQLNSAKRSKPEALPSPPSPELSPFVFSSA